MLAEKIFEELFYRPCPTLLLHTTKSVGQISDEIGFSNQIYFSRVFRETIGMTPSEYRETGGEL